MRDLHSSSEPFLSDADGESEEEKFLVRTSKNTKPLIQRTKENVIHTVLGLSTVSNAR